MRRNLPYIVAIALPLFAEAVLLQDITHGGFNSLLQEKELLIAAFSSQSYGPVQPFHEIFEEVAASARTSFAVVDCDKEEGLCKEYDVSAYPAVRLFSKRDGEKKPHMTRYRGKRNKKAIQSFVTKHEMPLATHVDPSSLQAFKKIDDVVVVAYLRPDQKALLDVFRAAASKHHRDFVFGYVTDMATADAESRAMPSIVCYKNNDGDDKIINGHYGGADIENLLELAKKSPIGDFTERDMDAYMAPAKLTAYIFATTADEATALRRELTPLAKKYEKYATFCAVDAVEFAPMAKNFGLAEDGFPALAVHAPMNDNVFTYHQNKKIVAPVVDAMLTTILQAKATSGQVFGSEAPEVETVEAQDRGRDRDEL